MSTRPARKIKSSLLGKGFRYDSNHHTHLIFFHKGKKTSFRTKISHGIPEYSDSLLGKMATRLTLSKKSLLCLIDCSWKEADYAKHIEKRRNM